MFLRMAYPAVAYDQYLPLMPAELTEELLATAEELKDLRIVHLNSTATGGGVAEILQSLIPLTDGLGISTERIVINPPPQFFQVTKRIHNLLQGAEGSLSAEELDIYFQSIENVAEDMRRKQVKADVWFLHDPQLLPLARMLPRDLNETWIWIGHIDFTNPNSEILDTLLPLTKDYDRLILSLPSYVPHGLDDMPPVFIAPPAIDPLAVKNMPLDQKRASSIVADMGVDSDRPLVCQVSRFDSWKDPWGVIGAFRLARQSVPGLQLALLGLSQAADDPEAVEIVTDVRRYAEGDPDIHIYFEPVGLPATIDEVVNAFQVVSDVIMQKSLREGFGLTVTEAMWKGKPVIGGNVGGIRIQIENQVTGFLVNSPEECAGRIVELMEDPELRSRIGRAAQESVRERFLMPSLVLDYLRVVKAHLPQPEASAPALNLLRMADRLAIA